jgi:digeranylgeranylglycerophospholipid reductase
VHTRVIVIGGGPIGAATARFVAELGGSVLLVERRARPVSVPACTGLVSPRALSSLGASDRSVLREIHAVRVHSPGGKRIVFRSTEAKGLVINRCALEEELLDLAASAGAEIRMCTEGHMDEYGRVILKSRLGTQTLEARVLIGADGPDSSVARAAGLSVSGSQVIGIQAIIEDPNPERDCVDVYFENTLNLFAWRVPAEDGLARVGLLAPVDANPLPLLQSLLSRRFASCRVVSVVGGRIPLVVVPRSVAGRVMLVGDAAGQVKPLSGGGLYTGALCARIAARFTVQTNTQASDDGTLLAGYDTAWRAELEPILSVSRALRSVLAVSSEADLDRLFEILDHPDVLHFIAEAGDIDHMGQLLNRISRRPALWRRLVGFLSLVDRRKFDALIRVYHR